MSVIDARTRISLPLIGHGSEQAVVAYRQGRPIDAAHFLGDVRALAAHLPAGGHVLNICSDRYRFAVGLCAALLTRKISLLPSTHTPEVIRRLREFAADAFCLTDDAECDIALPICQYPHSLPPPTSAWPAPRIDAAQAAAYVFTSGSTGTPIAHAKTWGKLMQCVAGEGQLLGLNSAAPPTLIATVPAQHMYGLESTVLMALQGGAAFCAERPFYPADIGAALAAAPRPRWLVTTPVHLRALLQSGVELPPTDLVLCATAHLSQALAKQTELRFDAPLMEIYGSTETGQIATRRPAREARWRLWPEVRLELDQQQAFVSGGHLESRTPLNDIVEPLDARHFLLHGRNTDLVNIAGKRSSFGYLNHQLLAIDGVVDGAFFLRDEADSPAGVTRLAALVVAPGLATADILHALRERIDAVFLPRPLLLIDSLPRNDTGKLPQQALRELAKALLAGRP